MVAFNPLPEFAIFYMPRTAFSELFVGRAFKTRA